MRQRKILVIDDEAAIRRLFRRALQGARLEIFTADSVASAEGLLKDPDIELIFCDYNMPGEKGLAFLSRLVTWRPKVWRVLITGEWDSTMQREACQAHLAHRCLNKPFDVQELRALVEELLFESVHPASPCRVDPAPLNKGAHWSE